MAGLTSRRLVAAHVARAARAAVVRGMLIGLMLGAAAVAFPTANAAVDSTGTAGTVAGCPGGLVVVVGAGQLNTVVSLAGSGRFVVALFDADPEQVEAAQRALQQAGLYGMATTDHLGDDGRLPLAENLVNVLLIDRDAAGRVSLAEAYRVLCPRGAVLLPGASDDALRAAGFSVEPFDGRLGGTTSGAPAASGSIESPGATWTLGRKPWPAEMDQWTHPRHGPDGNTVSDDATVAPPRRVRWIAGPPVEVANMVSAAGRNYYGGIWARDAFNGLRLWQQSLRPSPARGSFGYSVAAGAVAPVAVGSEVLVVHEGRLRALDGATGAAVREYPEAGTPKQLLVLDGVIVVADDRSVRALDLETGASRWLRETTEPQYLVAGDGRVLFLEGAARRGEKLAAVAVDLAGGQARWRKDQDEWPWLSLVRRLVTRLGLVVFEISTLADEKAGNAIHVADAASGEWLWNREFIPGMNHMKQARALFVGDRLWLVEHLKVVALDPRSGAVLESHPAGQCHCFPPVATPRYVLSGEFDLTDLVTGAIDARQITKAACGRDAGWIPANGLIYACPKHCVCWPMLRGYVALAPADPEGELPADVGAMEFPIERGVEPPAVSTQPVPAESPDDWPCYRHDAWRSAATPAVLPDELNLLWTVELGDRPEGPIGADWRENPFVRGPVTAPVVSGGRVYVARPDAHELLALDIRDGTVRWRVTLQGRVDTPPTIHAGLCLVGTRNGYVYCLRADDGRMVWRRRVAPRDRRIVSHGQIESPWPVAGSVLVVDGVAYFAAGRHSEAEGGILVFAVDPPSGEMRWINRIGEIPAMHYGSYGLPPGEVPQRRLYSCNALEFDCVDLPHREGDAVAVSRWLFDRSTGAMSVKAEEAFALLDTGPRGVVVPRGSWTYAPRHQPRLSGGEFPLRPLVALRDGMLVGCLDDMRTLYRRDFDAESARAVNRTWITGWAQQSNQRKKEGDLWRSQRLAREAAWTVPAFDTPEPDNHVGAMVLAGDRLLVAGTRGTLAVVSIEDGRRLNQRDVPPPLWDGMAAAEGRLLVATADGKLLCLGQ